MYTHRIRVRVRVMIRFWYESYKLRTSNFEIVQIDKSRATTAHYPTGEK